MKYTAKCLLMLLLCFCCGFGAAMAQELPAPTTDDTITPETQAKLAQAEQLADKFMARFADTLDFKVLLQEMFVKDETLRRHLAQRGEEEIAAPELLKQLDLATAEKFGAELNNLFWLLTAYWSLEANKENCRRVDKTKQLMETKVVPYLTAHQRTIYESVFAGFGFSCADSDLERETWLPSTQKEFITQTEIMSLMADAVREEVRRMMPERVLPEIAKGDSWDEEDFEEAGKFKVYIINRTASWLVCPMQFSIIRHLS